MISAFKSRIIALLVGVVVSQFAVAECGPAVSASLTTLESRLAQTQQKLAETPEADREREAYRTLQERALQELEAVQCQREAEAPAEVVKRGPGLDTAFVSVPVLFITDRKRTDSPAGAFFGGDRKESGVTYGRIVVRMPAESYSPAAPLPTGMIVDKEKNSSQGVSVAKPTEFEAADFEAQLSSFSSNLKKNTKLRVLLFIHGYNVSYVDSVKATARLAWGLRPVDVLPVAISWPSQGKLLRYWQDEQSVEPSIERLRPILGHMFADQQIDEVILVSHSMGTRIATRVLSQLQLQKEPLPKLTRVAFAAADLHDAELSELWARIQPLPAQGWTFYTSGNDFALLASSIVHARSPVGDSRDRVFTLPPADTVDASAVAPALKGYGHSYLIDNPRLQVDLRRWIVDGVPAAQRNLHRGQRPPADFWAIPESRGTMQ
jgi:esterase/lipase superfamily enzyme